MALLRLSLQALQYPNALTFSVNNHTDYRMLVMWLEDTKIRHYKVDDRQGLRSVEWSVWESAFAKYLRDVGCPVQYSQGAQSSLVTWLLSHAVGLEYADKADACSQAAGSGDQLRVQEPLPQRACAPYDDMGSPEVFASLEQLLAALHVRQPDAPLAQRLRTARQAVAEQLLPAAEGGAAGLPSLATRDAEGAVALDADAFPLGFSSGDTTVDTAATLLRVLHVKELRALQAQIDEALVAVQEYTANPSTDDTGRTIGK